MKKERKLWEKFLPDFIDRHYPKGGGNYQLGREEMKQECKTIIKQTKIKFPDYRNEDNRDREAMRLAWNQALTEVLERIEKL